MTRSRRPARDPGPLLHPEHEHNRGSAPWPEYAAGGIVPGLVDITLHHGHPPGIPPIVPPPPPAAGGIASMYVITTPTSGLDTVFDRMVRDRIRQHLEERGR